MLENWKATCNCNLSNLIGRQQSLKKDSCTSIDDDFVAECSSADNSTHTHTSTIGDVSVVCSAKDAAYEWKAPNGGSDDRN